MFTIDLSVGKGKKYVWGTGPDAITTRAKNYERAAEKILDKIQKKHSSIPHRFAIRSVKTVKGKKKYGDLIYFLSRREDDEILFSKCDIEWTYTKYDFMGLADLANVCSHFGYSTHHAESQFDEEHDNIPQITLEQKLLFTIDDYFGSATLYDEIMHSGKLRQFLGIKNNDKFWVRGPSVGQYIIGGIVHPDGVDAEYEFGSNYGTIGTFIAEHNRRAILENELKEIKRDNDLMDSQAKSIIKKSVKIDELRRRLISAKSNEKRAQQLVDEMSLRAVQAEQNVEIEKARADKMETSFMAAEQELIELRCKMEG